MSDSPTHWLDKPIPWDALYISGVIAPGMVDDIDISRAYKVDEKGGAGVNGATLTVQGLQLANVSIKLKLWTRNHLNTIDLLIYSIFRKPKQTKTVKPFDFTHPLLTMHGLRSLLVVDVLGPTNPNQDGFQFVTIKCKEFAPPPPKPAASATTTPKGTTPALPPGSWTAEDEQLLKNLEAEAKLRALHGDDTSKINERIWNLKQRKANTQYGPPSPPKGPGAGTPKP
jgi:hypothetical protein